MLKDQIELPLLPHLDAQLIVQTKIETLQTLAKYICLDLCILCLGNILAQNTQMTIVRNCYFEAGSAPDDGFGLPLGSDEMKTEAFVNRLNNGSTVFKMDVEPYENDGYPVFGTDGLIFVGAEWYYEILNGDGSVTYQHLQCVADTTVGGKRVKVIVRTNQIYDKGQVEITRECVYEENGVVYWWNSTLGKFTVLYDFSAEVGDEWTVEVGETAFTVKVFETELEYLNGIPYKKLTIEDPENIFSGKLLSNIGHLTSFFPEKLMTHGKGYRVEGLRCYWLDGDLVYRDGDKDCDEVYQIYHHGLDETADVVAVYPNPTDGLIHIALPSDDSFTDAFCLTNLLGQVVMTGRISDGTIHVPSLPNGIYGLKIGTSTFKIVIQKP